MKDIVISLISALIGGFGTAWLNLKGKQTDDVAKTEGVYADHTKDMWQRMDELYNQREELSKENFNLKAQLSKFQEQVSDLNETNERLQSQILQLQQTIKGLRSQIQKLTKVEERKARK